LVKSWFEEWKEAGIQAGIQAGKRDLLRQQLENRFGPLTEQAREELEKWTLERIEKAGLSILNARTIEDVGLPNGAATAKE